MSLKVYNKHVKLDNNNKDTHFNDEKYNGIT